ncbi:hypothetical protein IIY66_00400 [Candidatus Saccharibacteria bacterium]|nr:hypothetical protein [Candidatus Saccharibacteria bacterium]
MIEYSQYSNYIAHNKTFNIVFCTAIAILIDLFTGILLYNLGVMNGSWSIFIVFVLVIVPIIVFIVESTKYEGAIAYHCIWKDIYHGRIDRKLINQDYGKQHGIKNWKVYLREKEPDGRWNYHVYTKYMEQLVVSRNALLVKIAEEYAEICSGLKKDLDNTNEAIGKVSLQIRTSEDKLGEISKRLSRAATGAQKFYLEGERKTERNKLEALIEEKVDLKIRINSIEDDIRRHEIAYISQKSKIEQDYKIRSENYARIATKTIEKNGLKYVIDSLMAPEYWINNLQERNK